MVLNLEKEGKFTYAAAGKGKPIVVLHGLMGALSNFEHTFTHFSKKGYQVFIPKLPLYTLPLIKTNVKNLANFLNNFIKSKDLKDVILLGNSLGGHVALHYVKQHPKNISALILTGSSGLYENTIGNSYPKRGDRDFVAKKAREVFYDPAVATEELIDQVYNSINDRKILIRTLTIAKSAIRHNMANDLPNITQPTCLIWGKQDTVTPPEVAMDFDKLLPNSDLFWIDKCGHAAMMEKPSEFNKILENWFASKGI